jgi:hypothetical protein
MSLRGQAYPRQHRGYHLLRQLDLTPSADDLPYLDFSIVSPQPGADGRPLPVPVSWIPFPSVGEERLYVSPSVDEGALPAHFIQPLVARRRGHPARGGGYIGVDSRVWSRERYLPLPSGSAPPPATAEQPELGEPRQRITVETLLRSLGLASPNRPACGWDGHPRAPVRVAVIDTDCGGWGALRGVEEASLHMSPVGQWLQFPRSQQVPEPRQGMAGHGVVMAAAVEAVAPDVRVGLFEIPFAHASHVHATDLAAALARAVEGWSADIVLVAMAHACWGTPSHLRAILRGCARSGRGGKGTVIVCCTGRIDQNRDLHGDSTALASDDFNAQPWVIPVAACGLRGGWYRVHRHPLGRIGPSVELCAPGDLVTFPSVGAADDSSLAAALVAGTVARMLATHPGLSLIELRQLLRATAVQLPAEEDAAAPGLEAGHFNAWDRAGHNFKLGHGRVDTLGACLAAADPVCYALLATRHSGSALPAPAATELEREAARGWESFLRRESSRSDLARRYLALRGHLVPVVLRAPALQDALFWLTRHLRALRLYAPAQQPEDGTDQGALSDRCLHVLDVLSGLLDQLPAKAPAKELSKWLHEMIRLLSISPPQAVARFLTEAIPFSLSTPD